VKVKSVKTTDDDDEYTTVIKVRLVKFYCNGVHRGTDYFHYYFILLKWCTR
ncbi:unnamed protein product, partial [Tenebrio molitor]